MLDGYCAITSLRMNLDYYGFEVEQSMLLNLGWNYGFFFMSTPFYNAAYPDTDPVEEIVFAAEHLGFKAKVVTHDSLEEAKITLVKYISQNKPVIVQWIPHSVLAYGYKDNGARIIYNDPGEPASTVQQAAFDDFCPPSRLASHCDQERVLSRSAGSDTSPSNRRVITKFRSSASEWCWSDASPIDTEGGELMGTM